MTIKAILFDKDGTLLDFDATFAPATAKVLNSLAAGDADLARQMAKAVDFEPESQSITAGSVLIAGSLENIAECLLPFVTTDSLTELLDLIDALYVEYSLETLAPFEFLESALTALEQMNLSLGVATNDSEVAAHAHLKQIDVAERFCFIAGYDSGYGEKPKPGMVTAYAANLGLAPEEIIMIGDSPHDCDAGRAGGAIAVAVTSGGAGAEQLRPHADHVIANISELAGLVKELNRTH